MSNSLTRHWRGYARARGLPIVEDLERGLAAVRHLTDYAAYRRRVDKVSARPRESGDPELRVAASRPPGLDFRLRGNERGRVLTEAESKKILAAAGLPVTREALARDPAEAMRIAAEIGGPVALKIQSPDIPHKSDIGGVHLGARTPAQVEAAARGVLDNARRNCPSATIDGVLVQEMVEDGVEFILGMSYDATFGPLIVCGAGGITVELFKDTAVALPPLAAEDVDAMLRSLKVSRHFDGFRGAPPRDRSALIDCCLRFSDFVVATDGRFAAIDLNPVFVCTRGVRIADALIETRAGD
jgi:acetyltransferase